MTTVSINECCYALWLEYILGLESIVLRILFILLSTSSDYE